MFFSHKFGFFSIALIVFFLACCASNDTATAQKYRDDGSPVWIEASFTNPSGFWAGYNNEKGYYASGKAKYGEEKTSTRAAELDAKKNLLEFVRSQSQANEKLSQLVGIQKVDQFFAKDGTVYALMFISEKSVKKSRRL